MFLAVAMKFLQQNLLFGTLQLYKIEKNLCHLSNSLQKFSKIKKIKFKNSTKIKYTMQRASLNLFKKNFERYTWQLKKSEK